MLKTSNMKTINCLGLVSEKVLQCAENILSIHPDAKLSFGSHNGKSNAVIIKEGIAFVIYDNRIEITNGKDKENYSMEEINIFTRLKKLVLS
jgi:hypothetical protein